MQSLSSIHDHASKLSEGFQHSSPLLCWSKPDLQIYQTSRSELKPELKLSEFEPSSEALLQIIQMSESSLSSYSSSTEL